MIGLSNRSRLWITVFAIVAATTRQSPAQDSEPDWTMAQPGNPAASLCANECVIAPPRCPIYMQFEALALRRDVHHATDFATANDPDTLVLSTRDLDMPFKAGPRFLVGHTFDDSPYQVEFSYFWLDKDYNDTVAVQSAAGNLLSPFSGFGVNALIDGLDNNNFVQITETSSLQSAELNLVRLLPMPPERLTAAFLLGARFVGIREGLNYQSSTAIPVASTATVLTRTRNELYGAQIGGRFDYYVEQHWWINTEVKGAMCNNAAGQDTTFTSTSLGNGNGPFSRSQNVTSFIGDLNVSIVCRPTSWLSARMGYQAMWLTGMAIAAENFNPNVPVLQDGPAQIIHNGTVVYHGPHAGLEIVW